MLTHQNILFTMIETPSLHFMQIFINKDVFIAHNLFIPHCQLRSLLVKLQNPAAWFFFFLIHVRWKMNRKSEIATSERTWYSKFISSVNAKSQSSDNSSELVTPPIAILFKQAKQQQLRFFGGFPDGRRPAEHSTRMVSLDDPDIPTRWVLLSVLFPTLLYKWGGWGLERLYHLFPVTR